MTKYALPEDVMNRHFNDCRRITNISVTMGADYLTRDLIKVFVEQRDFFYSIGHDDYGNGIQHCIDHLNDFLET